MAYSIKVNGAQYDVDADGDTPLLWVLRDNLGLTGTKYGCGIGQCGACSVHADGAVARSCSVSLESATGMEIRTIEGLGSGGQHKLQAAWVAEDVSQCGYCQTGQIMAAAALLANGAKPTDAEIDAAMSNICRCGTYNRIKAAIKRASAQA
ncbi:MAG: 2Fe-2S iron-sulfur cluster binding domain-containing protein [Alphaproteobacteria bacterium]|nr:2Fe-2S iron-sulfur cluster binding domain-containing protein [Alphaproteobacteria bacterium]